MSASVPDRACAPTGLSQQAVSGIAASPSRDTYRGWTIDWDYGRFRAAGPNYEASWEGEEDGWVASGGSTDALTRDDLIAEIDAWIEDHPGDQA